MNPAPHTPAEVQQLARTASTAYDGIARHTGEAMANAVALASDLETPAAADHSPRPPRGWQPLAENMSALGFLVDALPLEDESL